MSDEYVERYQAVEHSQLYRELSAGAPPSLDALSDVWQTAAQTLQTTAADLRADLAKLQASWSGETSKEYQYRLGLAASFAEGLAEQAINLHTGLSTMSVALTEAQSRGTPAPTNDTDWEHDAMLGTLLGHTVTDAELAQSHDQLVTVVADLAVSYDLADRSDWSTPAPDPSPDLPGQALAVDVGVANAQDAGATPANATVVPAVVTPVSTTVVPAAATLAAPVATQLAGTIGGPPPAVTSPAMASPALSAPSLVSPLSGAATPLPPSLIGTVTSLQGAGTSLAASTGSGLAAARGSTASTATGSSASLPPPVMGGGPASGSAQPGPVSRSLFDDETAWAGENDAWANHRDESPPPVLGHPNGSV
ncbi:hypothetical protein GCM10023322_28070 [Rugosimonospora acidiphila]|uniref:PPE family protein n=1 Tax=Rugosimonospora acidiphila TaxID=556531 RepID=A0ABP9RQY4_9ACTN